MAPFPELEPRGFFCFFFSRRPQFPFRCAFAAAALSEHALHYPFSGSYIRRDLEGDLDPGWIICPPVGVRQGAAGRPDASLECLRQSGQKKFRLNLEKTEIHPTHYFDAFTGSFYVTLICVLNFPVFAKPKAHLGGGRGGCLSSRQAAELPVL